MDDSDTISSLKENFNEDPSALVLSFAGKPLQDASTFEESGLKEGNTVYLSRRMRGELGATMPLGQEESCDFFGEEHKPEMARAHSDIYAFKNPEFLLPAEEPVAMMERMNTRTPAPAVERMDSGSRNFLDDMSAGEMHAHTFIPHTVSQPVVENATEYHESSSEDESTDADGAQVQSSTLVGAKRKNVDDESHSPLRASKARKKETIAQPAAAPARYAAPQVYMPPQFQMPTMQPPPQFFPLMMQQQNRKGVAYDLEKCDERLRKRLLKNRRSAERSRQKKNAALQDCQELLQQSESEKAELKKEVDKLKQWNSELERQTVTMRDLLHANGINAPF